MRMSRRGLLEVGTASALLTGTSPARAHGIITPEQFGAAGDGRTNDTDAFAAMAAHVNRLGGGAIALQPTTYIVGWQTAHTTEGYALAPAKIMDFVGCTRPLVLKGNGARLRCAPGLRYGTFDPKTWRRTEHRMPYFGSGELTSPYVAMIRVADCAGPVEISDLELDGNLTTLRIGGPYGDAQWQIGLAGIMLINNLGSERLSRIHSHHHAQDGITIDGSPERKGTGVLEHVRCEFNVRQGCSLVGGRAYVFRNCQFNHTGKAGMMSAPGAGIDIEAEVKRIRDLSFVNCEFSDNSGPGLLADMGDTEGASFRNCRFIGTTNWSAWPSKPRFIFYGCEFVGSITHAYGDHDPARATRFFDCVFRDDPALSPTGGVYNVEAGHPIAELPYSQNVMFKRCRFELTNNAVLPWTTNVVIFDDCSMSQSSSKVAYPRATYLGRNRIDGAVDLYSSRVVGELFVNGERVPPN